MPKFNSPKPAFSAGELSPKVLARTDLPQYSQGCERIENMIVQPQGGAIRRPGSVYVKTNEGNNPARLIPFVYSKTEAYCVEITNGAMVVVDNVNRARFTVTLGATAVGGYNVWERSYYYATSDLAQIQYAQSADTLYLVCPNKYPQLLVRTAANTFTLWPYNNDFRLTDIGSRAKRMPFLPANVNSAWTITPGAASGSTTFTTLGGFFNPGHVGTLFKLNGPSARTDAFVVTGYTDSNHVTGTFLGSGLASVAAISNWEEGAWSDYRGWPRTICFFKSRLCYGGNAYKPDTIWCSRISNYTHLMATWFTQDATTDVSGNAFTGPLAADYPVSFSLASQEVNQIQWLSSGKTLAIGTLGAEYIGSDISATTAPSFPAESTRGSAFVQPKRVGYTLMYVPRDGKRLFEMVFDYYSQSYVSTDLALHADHMVLKQATAVGSTSAAITQIEYQENRGIIWAVNNAGALIGITRQKENNVAAWHYHPLGGSLSGSAPAVSSIAIVPSRDPLGNDDLWISVQRTVNGATLNSLEVIGRDYDYDSMVTTLPMDIQPTYSDSSVMFDNGAGVTATVFTGIAPHLVGQTVSVLADGIPQAPKVVGALGTVTIDTAARVLVVGLPVTPVLVPTRPDAGAALGSAIGGKKKIDRVALILYRTKICKVGRDANNLDSIQFRPSTLPATAEIPYYTGEKVIPFRGDFDNDGYVYITADLPLPMNIVGVFIRGETNEI